MRTLSAIQTQTLNLVTQAEKILCDTTKNARGDGLMSILAAKNWLEEMGKTVKAVFPDAIPGNFEFIDGVTTIEDEFSRQGNVVISVTKGTKDGELDYSVGKNGEVNIVLPVKKEAVALRQEDEKYDLILCFGVDRLTDLGGIYSEHIDFFQNTPLVNISANAGDAFAKFNLTDPTKSGATELLYDLIMAQGSAIDEELATILLTGVIASSESFLGEGTTASAFLTASQLQAAGATQSDIIENLYKKKSLKTLKLWGQVFSRLEFDQTHRVCYSTLHKTDFSMIEATPDQIENLTRDILRFVDGSDFFALFYEFDGVIEAQVRTSSPSVDWEQALRTKDFMLTHGGADLRFTDRHLAEVEQDITSQLCAYQITNKGINRAAVTTYKDCRPEGEKAVENVLADEVIVPKAPEIIPFEAPFQPNESTGEIPEQTKPSNDGKKGWIKKSFPRN